MFGYFRKGRSESKTFIEDKVKWFHFMKGFNDLFYEYTLYNILKRYPDYRIEQGEYIESLKHFNELCEYEEKRNTKRLIRKVTGMSNKRYKEFLNDVKRRVYRYDLESEILVAKIAKATDLPVNNYTVAIAMRWLNIGRGWNVQHIKVGDLLDAIIEIKEEDN